MMMLCSHVVQSSSGAASCFQAHTICADVKEVDSEGMHQ